MCVTLLSDVPKIYTQDLDKTFSFETNSNPKMQVANILKRLSNQ